MTSRLLLKDFHQEFHDEKYSWSIKNSEVRARYGEGVTTQLTIINPDSKNEVEFGYSVDETKLSPLNGPGGNGLRVWIFLPAPDTLKRFPALRGSKVFVHNS